MAPLHVDIKECPYKAMIGTGGIGSGMFFALNGNHTLGREESRSGHFIDRRDYCKLHIVSHYVRMLLGPGFHTIPVGMIGEDETGRRLYREMEEAGLDMRYVEMLSTAPTLFSFCFIYPDGSGGNLTTDDSASAKVDEEAILRATDAFERYRERGIALALPEVSLDARIKLLDLGSRYSFFRVASFTMGEMREMRRTDIFKSIDLLAMNLEEVMQLTEISNHKVNEERIVKGSVEFLARSYPHMKATITAGSGGSWVWDDEKLSYFPAFEAEVVSTAGAGDAFLAGIISGLTAGLTLSEAQELGTLVGSLSVTSLHTIHKGINRSTLYEFSGKVHSKLSVRVKQLL